MDSTKVETIQYGFNKGRNRTIWIPLEVKNKGRSHTTWIQPGVNNKGRNHTTWNNKGRNHFHGFKCFKVLDHV